MSLLMEALRKAEEAKSKAAQEETGVSSEAIIQEASDTASTYSASSDRASAQVNSTPIEKSANAEKIEFVTQQASLQNTASEAITTDKASQQESQPPIDDAISADQLSLKVKTDQGQNSATLKASSVDKKAPNSTSASENTDSSNINELTPKKTKNSNTDRYAVNALFQAKHATQQQKKRKTIRLLIALILLFPIGGIVYWVYNNTLDSNTEFSIPPTLSSTNQRFLGDDPALSNPETRSEMVIENEAITSAALSLSGNSTDIQDSEIGDLETNNDLTNEDLPIQPVDREPNASLSSTAPESVNSSVAINSAALQQEEEPIAGQQATEVTVQQPAISFIRSQTNKLIDPLLTQAFESYQNGNYNESLGQYQSVLAKNPNSHDALLGAAAIYRKQNNNVSAREMYSRILRLNPRDPLALTGILDSAQAIDPRRQEAELKSLLTLHPDVAPLSFALANLYASQNRWNEAQSAYFNASISAKNNSAGPISPDYLFNLAVSLERLNQLRPAYNYYQEALELTRYSTPGFEMLLLNQRLEYLEQALP